VLSAHTRYSDRPAETRPKAWVSLLLSGAFWGGLALVAMWLAVLFVGVFGGNVVNATPGGSSGSWPVVIVVAVAALLGTISVGRWAFGSPRADRDLRRAVDDERRDLDRLSAQLEAMRQRLPD
jgi:uncharacterized membrane protein YccC